MAVPVVGLDIGYQSCYVALAKGGGIETAANEVSERATPTCVSFGEKTRFVGAPAKQQQISNFKNTLSGFTKLLGRSYNDPIVQDEMKKLPYKVVDLGGKAGVQVQYLNDAHSFHIEQIVAMVLTRLKHIVEDNLQTRMVDCVISVPTSFTDVERRAMLDAAHIAGLNCVRLFNDTTAVGLAYGFFKKDLPAPEESSRNTLFLDVGHSSTKTAIIAFNKGKMKVLATSCDQNLGGRDFDTCIFDRMVEEFKKKYRLDVRSSPKACLRLMAECEKLKKLMSANSTALPLNIECFMEDKDVTSHMKREEFESIAAPLFQRMEGLIKQVLADAHLQIGDLHSVEIVGGGTRMPEVKKIVRQVTGLEPSTTLNADEAVARGCALQCAIFSPALRVQNFNVTDTQAYPIQLRWVDPNTGENDSMEIFPAWHQIPFSRQITFYRREPFMVEAVYLNPENVKHTQKSLGKFYIKNVAPTSGDEPMKVLVKLRINLHGIFSVSQAHYVDKVEVEETYQPEPATTNGTEATAETANNSTTTPQGDPIDPNAKNDSEAMDTSEEAPESASSAEKPSGKKGTPSKGKKETATRIVTKQKKIELPVEAQVAQFDTTTLTDYTDRESKMIMQDKLERERSNAKNALEEYVYEIRDKISDQFQNFMTDKEREATSKTLTQMEDWLYDEGYDECKQAYVDRLTGLRETCSKFQTRYVESTERPRAFEELGRAVMRVSKALDSFIAGDAEYAHIERSEMDKVAKSLKETHSWMNEQMNAQTKLKPTSDPTVLSSTILGKMKTLEAECNPILTKPKPAPPKEEPPKDTNKSNNQTDQNEEAMENSNNAEPNDKDTEKDAKDAKEDMDLD